MDSQALEDLGVLVVQLRQQLDGVDGRIDGLEHTLGNLAEQLDVHSEVLQAKDPAFLLSPWWWPTMTQGQAGEAWTTLTQWVDGLIIPRYDDGENTMPTAGAQVLRPEEVGLPYSSRVLRCWFAHPGIVDQLSALFWAQKGDYRRNAPAHSPLEWQETWLPKTLDHLGDEFRKKKCIGSCPHLDGTISGEWHTVKHDLLNLRDRSQWIKADVARRLA